MIVEFIWMIDCLELLDWRVWLCWEDAFEERKVRELWEDENLCTLTSSLNHECELCRCDTGSRALSSRSAIVVEDNSIAHVNIVVEPRLTFEGVN